jgi:hypothetical protein
LVGTDAVSLSLDFVTSPADAAWTKDTRVLLHHRETVTQPDE